MTDKTKKVASPYDPSDGKESISAPVRLLNRDGTFNVLSKDKSRAIKDVYHRALSVSWSRFLLDTVLLYLAANLIFAFLYYLCGPEGLSGTTGDTPWHRFSDEFFFSVQTFSTIGYGKIVPASFAANVVVTLESLAGLLGFALATGILFSRFSRPTARVIFSDVAVINSHEGVPSFIFRIANERLNQVVDAEISVVLSIAEKTKEGESYRTFYDLNLERKKSPIFILTWTVVHPITPDSPLYGRSKEDLIDAQAEIVVSFLGLDETFAQTIHARFFLHPLRNPLGQSF